MLLSFLVGCGLGYIGYQAALVIVGYFLTKAETFEDLAASVLRWVYAMSASVVGSWLFFGAGSNYVIALALAHAISLSLIDLEATFESN